MNKSRLEEIIRVDHAGEHGATSIYKGCLLYTSDAADE